MPTEIATIRRHSSSSVAPGGGTPTTIEVGQRPTSEQGYTAPKETGVRAWVKRNWWHVILLAAAIAAVVAAILGSLEACSSEQQNVTRTTTRVESRLVNVTVTVNTTVTTITPLASLVLLDGSGSMRPDYDNSGSACTGFNEYYCCSDSAGAPCKLNTKWAQAKGAIETLNDALDAKMNNNSQFTDKLYTGLVQWSNADAITVRSNLKKGVAAANAAAKALDIPPKHGTQWGPAICTCYKELMSNPDAKEANKMCVLLADGELNKPAELGTGSCASPGGRGKNGGCPCDYLWADAEATGYVSKKGYANTANTYVEEFTKSRGVTILSVLVGQPGKGADQYLASSCDSDKTPYNAAKPPTDCDYYLELDSFDKLKEKATGIAAKAFGRATESKTDTKTEEESKTVTDKFVKSETVEDSVSICSLDFLWALLAFLPLLLYILYRILTIKMRSHHIQDQLYDMIQKGDLKREDVHNLAQVATHLLLPELRSGDIDYGISYSMFRCCSCLLPASDRELAIAFNKQESIPL